MRRKIVLTICAMSLLVSGYLYPSPSADNQEMEERVKNIVLAAYDYISLHSNDMTLVQNVLQYDPRFIDPENQLYIFMHSYNVSRREAVCRAHGIRTELIGKNMWSLRTPTGRLLFHEIVEIVENKGEGWIEYDWLNPFSDSLETKRSFVKGIVLYDGSTAWIGCGYWKKPE